MDKRRGTPRPFRDVAGALGSTVEIRMDTGSQGIRRRPPERRTHGNGDCYPSCIRRDDYIHGATVRAGSRNQCGEPS